MEITVAVSIPASVFWVKAGIAAMLINNNITRQVLFMGAPLLDRAQSIARRHASASRYDEAGDCFAVHRLPLRATPRRCLREARPSPV